MTIKHTSAPWIVKGNKIEGFTIRDGSNNVIIAETNIYLIQTESNANLIAAAPDLLDSLTDLFNDVMYLGFAEDCKESFKKASKAIDKATGEQI